MNPINASSLLHFTKDFNGLKGILQKGFKYSYCCEEFSQTIVANEIYPDNPVFFKPILNINPYVAIPMVCFCDIPLTRAMQHANMYGKFIIGLDKSIAMSLYRDLLNPVLYKNSNLMETGLNDLSVVKAQSQKITGCKNLNQSICQIIGLTKPYIGENKIQTFDGKVEILKDYCFYDEREWRIFMPDGYDEDIKWYWNINPDEFKENKHEYNRILEKTKYAYVGFVKELKEEIDKEIFTNFITHIIVDTDENIPKMVDFILNPQNSLFNYDKVPIKIRKILVSKITSFERIEKDF